MKLSIPALALAATVGAGSVLAASMEQMAQSVINTRGINCSRVTAVNPLGTTESGTPVVAVACSNGERHVLTIQPNDTFKYLTSCGAFEASTRKKCF